MATVSKQIDALLLVSLKAIFKLPRKQQPYYAVTAAAIRLQLEEDQPVAT